jgi:predicted DCC family thiol-disulfide oxidoreductase YuxK
VEKSPRLNWATQFLTVAYDGACSPNVCQNGVNFLRRLDCRRKKKLDDSSRLDVVEIARVA